MRPGDLGRHRLPDVEHRAFHRRNGFDVAVKPEQVAAGHRRRGQVVGSGVEEKLVQVGHVGLVSMVEDRGDWSDWRRVARARDSRERTVPTGMSSTVAISA